jgi:hypothetical protein
MAYLQLAKNVLLENATVLYGVFGVIEESGYFPPREFLNEFFMIGHDPCDQDRRLNHYALKVHRLLKGLKAPVNSFQYEVSPILI